MENLEDAASQPETSAEAVADPESARGFMARTAERLSDALAEYMELPMVDKLKNISMNALGAICTYAGVHGLAAGGLGNVSQDVVVAALPALLFGAAYLQQKSARSLNRPISDLRKNTEGGA